MYGLTKIRGVGRRFSAQVCRAAEIDMAKRAGELTSAELDRICAVVASPLEYNIPKYFLNSQRDWTEGGFQQLTTGAIDGDMRNTMERLKKNRIHRGIRHFWGLKVRGQHTCTTGRGGAAFRMSKNNMSRN